MSEDVVKRLRLSKESVEYIQWFAEQKGIPHDNRTINTIIEEHKQFETKEKFEETLINTISENVTKEMKKELKRILLGTNNTDRNTQVLIELLNGLFIKDDVSDILTTEDLESKPLQTAKDTVQRRIEYLQQKRADYYSKKGGG
ncbi:hypothetical protein [Halalkalibacter lacteus]|uniref:hypothetical protein n=1 Tax=Halalkalibacter lacteus TaxID=3090663 RepID=UPI002FC770DA